MSWTEDVAAGVREALTRGGPQRVAVHTEAQAELARIAARRMKPGIALPPFKGTVENLTFEISPDYVPLGSILV